MTYMASKNCDNQANIECPLGVREFIVCWRWINEEAYRTETLCKQCADDIRHGVTTSEIVLVWESTLAELAAELTDIVSGDDNDDHEVYYKQEAMV